MNTLITLKNHTFLSHSNIQKFAHSKIQKMNNKPSLNFWQIWNMSFGFLGIQFGFELQNGNVSRIFETMGANPDEISILWAAAPATGLLVQPIIGYLSDRTWSPTWGRRRPFFFIGALLSTFALIFMPNTWELWVAGGALWIMDASFNITMEPFRAFVGDKLPEEQRTSGFAMQSFFIGIGSLIAAVLPWTFTNVFHFSNQAGAGQVPDSVRWSFYFGAAALFLSVLYTIFTTKEYPPSDMAAFEAEKAKSGFLDGVKETFLGIFKMPKTMQQLAVVQFFSWFAMFCMWIYTTNAVTSNVYNMKIDRALFTKVETAVTKAAADATTPKERKAAAVLSGSVAEINRFQKGGDQIVASVNLASHFQKDSTNFTADEQAQFKRVNSEFNTGADWLGWCSFVRNLIAALFAFLLPVIAARTSRKVTHTLCLIVGGLGLFSIQFVHSPQLLLVSMGMVGIAWASILSVPYAMLAGALPENKMGYYMGVFNFFIVIPQLVAAFGLGAVVNNIFNGQTMPIIAIGGISMILAGLFSLRVDDASSVNVDEIG
jgi:maltose/moltooligosaccharide transporter